MKITVSEEARAYIKSRSQSGSAVIQVQRVQGGWCTYRVPSVEIGKPSHPEYFEEVLVDDVTLYIEHGVRFVPEGAELVYSKGLFRKGLRILGIFLD